jgi:hypothetical protein
MKLCKSDLNRLNTIKSEIKGLMSDVQMAVNKAQFQISFLLAEVRSKKLYLENYETMDEFLDKELHVSPRRGYQLIQAAVTVKALPESLQPLVDNERVAREVAKLPEPARATTLAKVKERGVPVTAKIIREVSNEQNNGHTPAPKDDTGMVVPAPALAYWERRFEVKQLIESVQQVKADVMVAWNHGKDSDILYFGKGKLTQTFITDLENVISHLKSIMPYAVCPYCSGKVIETCAYCNKTGVIDRNRFNAAPAELLAMREKVVGEGK